MKAVIFSDLHVFPHRFGASIDAATGRHSRLQHCLDVLDQTAAAATAEGAQFRLFCGDMFHDRGWLKPSILNPVVEHFRKPKSFVDILIPGNHDMEARSEGEHSIEALNGLPQTLVLDHDGAGYVSIPVPAPDFPTGVGYVCYTPDVTELKARVASAAAAARLDTKSYKKVFLLHHGVDGAMPFIPDCGFGVGDLPTSDFDFVFCGDYHNHKRLAANAWMVGAPIHHNFGDADQMRGYMVVDLSTGAHTLREVAGVPKFVTLDVKAAHATLLSPEAFKGNFARVRCDDDKVLDALAGQIESMGALAVTKELVKDWTAIARADVTLTMTTSQMFAKWLDGEELGAFIDKGEVIALNDDILKEAGVA